MENEITPPKVENVDDLKSKQKSKEQDKIEHTKHESKLDAISRIENKRTNQDFLQKRDFYKAKNMRLAKHRLSFLRQGSLFLRFQLFPLFRFLLRFPVPSPRFR